MTDDIDYRALADFVKKRAGGSVAAKGYVGRGERPILLDAGTGTGNLIKCLKEDFDCIGLDVSEEMLDVARQENGADNVLWICQDMSKMDLYGSVAAVVSLTDSVNHLLTEKKLLGFFDRAHNFLDPGGILIFDVLKPERFEALKGGAEFFEDLDEVSCFWTGKYDAGKGICTYNISCFRLTDPDTMTYVRSDDRVRERYWAPEAVEAALKAAGFERVKRIEGGKRGAPGGSTGKDRLYYICEKNC